MYDSNYSAETLINEIDGEINLNFPVTKAKYCSWINMVEQMLYTDIVREQRKVECPFERVIRMDLTPPADDYCDIPRTEDIVTVYRVKDGVRTELEHASIRNELSDVQDLSYHIEGQRVFINADDGDGIILVFLARPVPKKVIGERVLGTINVPYEFLEVFRCRLRGERFRLINEDDLCAKWINEYNFHLENFKNYVETRRESV